MFFSPSRRQGRFKPLLVDKDEYLLPLSRYIHLNPIRTSRRFKDAEFSTKSISTNPGTNRWNIKFKNLTAFLQKERKRKFELSRNDRFRYRMRYFTDSGIIGSKEFVSKTYMRFMHHFNSKNKKKPKPIKGLSGVYSLKRLSEVIWKQFYSLPDKDFGLRYQSPPFTTYSLYALLTGLLLFLPK